MGIERIGRETTAGTKPNRGRGLRGGAVLVGGLALAATTLTACAGLGAAGPIQVGLKCNTGYDNEFTNEGFNAPPATPTGRTAPITGSGDVGNFYKIMDNGNGNANNTFALLKLLDINGSGVETFALLDGTLTTTSSNGETTTLQGPDPGAENDLPDAGTSVQVKGEIGALLGVIDPDTNPVGVYVGSASSSAGSTPSSISGVGLAAYCDYPQKKQ